MSMICSHCKAPLEDFYIEVSLHTKVFRKTAQETIDEIQNGDLCNNAVLCKECFDKFAETLLNFDTSSEE